MKKQQNRIRPNQKLKQRLRKGKSSAKCRYMMTNRGLIPFI